MFMIGGILRSSLYKSPTSLYKSLKRKASARNSQFADSFLVFKCDLTLVSPAPIRKSGPPNWSTIYVDVAHLGRALCSYQFAWSTAGLGSNISISPTKAPRHLYQRLNSDPPSLFPFPPTLMDSIFPLKPHLLTPKPSADFLPFSLQYPPPRRHVLPALSRKHMNTRCEFDIKGNGALSADTDRRLLDRVNFYATLSAYLFKWKKCIWRCMGSSNSLSIDVFVRNPYWVLSQVAVFCHRLVKMILGVVICMFRSGCGMFCWKPM